MSTLAEILYKDLNNEYYIRRIISSMAMIEYDSAESMKLGISTILSVLVNGTLKGTYSLDDVLEMYTGRILLKLAKVYLKYAVKPDHTPRLRAKHVHQLSRNIMDCVDMAVIAQDRNVTKLAPEENISYDVYDNLNVASNDMAEALMISMYLVGRVQPYGAVGRQIRSTEGVSEMYSYVNNADGLVDVAGSNITSYVNISKSLANTFDENHDLMLQFAPIKKNLFWWAQNNINTEIIMVGLAERLYRPGYYYVPKVEAPVQIFMKVKKMEKTTIRGVATQLDPTLDSDTLDKIVLVHRFILPPLSKLFITFKFDGNSSTSSLRVLINFNERPNWEALSGANVVSQQNPDVVIPYDIVEREHFYFMGILPDKSVPVNSTVDYSFDLHFVNCHIWENQWINHYCLVGPKTSEETVECQCTHMSIFSSSIFVPPNDINPILDAPLFLTVPENPYVVIFVIVILLLFLLLLLWAYRKDRKDALCSDVIVLHDNFPGESYAYLIAVFTGSRLTAGTSAVVGLRLYGDTYATRPTVLKCETRRVLQRDNDDWFLLCYPVSLGILNAVQLWHDNSGRNPDWYCSKVIVYDLQATTQYLFVIDQWLALEVDEFPESMVRPATTDEVLSVKRIFLDNSVLGFRENHLHLSILARHPRSPVSRKQRLMVLMVLIMSAMLASIMFFKVTDKFAENVDEYHYSFGQRELMISIQSFVISTVFAFIAMFLFRKGYKQRDYQYNKRSTLYMPRKRSSITDKYWFSDKPAFVDLSTFIAYDEKPPKQRKDMTMYESFIAAIRNCTHHKTLRPVHLATEGSEIKVNKGWLIAAWVFSILVIIICAYLVMLYSLKFGKVKSLKWLSSLVAAQAQDIFIFSPLKILILALLLSAAFERTTDISAFKLDVNKAVKCDLVGDKKYLDNLIEYRTKSIYYPMTDEVKAVSRWCLKKIQ
ncbi:polycystin family receptor for egg jelly [Macrosteles quadrilineatus]|uniref:polycystin family receptor for egg jelly n=1 Tax=Macrosteles quadrilineatus TaxID=74068 RepID=UPI0023E3012E|nr:polycystin family receptor for egg jelly [Macrosteles quadrilineatus]